MATGSPTSSRVRVPAAVRTCASGPAQRCREIQGSGFFAYDPAFGGGVTVAMSDLDRDGRNEIVTGPMNGPPIVRIWTGTTFTLLGEYFAYDPSAGGSGVFLGSVAENPSIDDAPSVTATTPLNGGTNVAVNADLVVTFSEAVNVTAAAPSSCSAARRSR